MLELGLTLNVHNMEAFLISSRKIVEKTEMIVRNTKIE